MEFYRAAGVPADRFTVIDNALDPPPPPIDRDQAFANLGLSPSRRLVVAVGRLWPQKRIRDLIWSAELLGTVLLDVTLVIVGDGPQRDELIRHPRPCHAGSPRLVRRGSGTTWPLGCRTLRRFGSPASTEGQPNAVLEAMAAGVPVVASDIARAPRF